MIHEFGDSLEYGEQMEKKLDSYFQQWFDIATVTLDLQKLGVDRIFTKKVTGERFSVEYKSDRMAGKTGNAFIETVSVRKDRKIEKLGWAHTSIAQRILYYVPETQLVYILDTVQVRDLLVEWQKKYRSMTADNGDYEGEGVLVPMDEINKIARGRMKVDG